MANNLFNMDTPNLTELIHSMDNISDNVTKAIAGGLVEGVKIINDEQKRIISAKYPSLASGIKSDGRVHKYKNHDLYVTSGYSSSFIKEHIESVIIEFGRPNPNKTHMEQRRKGKKYRVKIGKIAAYPHIRQGLTNKQDKAAAYVVNKVRKAIENEFGS